VSSMDDERAELDYEAEGKRDDRKGVSVTAFEGTSNRRYSCTANDFHLAVQRAALAAAERQDSSEQWYELSHVQVLVRKNPNVVMYSATLVASHRPTTSDVHGGS
jgi:hypothetical protein